MNANFLPLALGKIDELGRHRETRRLLQERADLASERTAGNVGQPEGVFDYRIIGAADFERSLPRPDVQPGVAGDVAFQNQFSNQL